MISYKNYHFESILSFLYENDFAICALANQALHVSLKLQHQMTRLYYTT